MSDPRSNDGLRVFKSSIFPDVPLCIGRKGASWFLCFSCPVGARGTRIHACINRIDTSFPFPSELREGHTKFVFDTHGPNHGILQQLLKVDDPPLLRKTGTEFGSGIEKLPEVEVLITPAETLRCCGRCNKWEAVCMPRFQVCSSCKLRYYCSKECQKADWKPSLHKSECPLLKEGKENEVEARRRTHDNEWWLKNKMREMETSYEDADALFDDPDYFLYGAHDSLRKG
ncbi:hypothetical protein PILCRDRAFT_15608 [Piloderma croceum F 1598]|uniref:MYND-type domain-containing protein n=1 Tax=Piloderma croceum (strain F 1598) TaxID=765440 RepID=A0A0C3EK51_PILCF|nr:hypothetical protein PILCRDRAFT_15608 [Piloderma croceum F 1598]